MSRFLKRWTGRSENILPRDRKRRSQRRRLKPETLETRQLLAANIFHNELMPEDVNEDGVVSAIDALVIINQVNQQDTVGDAEPANADQRQERGRGRMTDVNNDGRDTPLDALMVINRLNRRDGGGDNRGDEQVPPDDQRNDNPTTNDEGEVRSIDGSGNNLENPELGSADTELLRVAENDYADGISTPAGEDRVSARVISNTLSAANGENATSERDLSSFVFAWGQFLDHDIDLSLEPESEETTEAFDIEVPLGDALFDPFATGEATIHLTRSATAEGTGTSADNPAEQVNSITAWIDGSQVYGSDQGTSDSLREFVGGRLLVSDDGLLPTDENGGILAGDIRAAENVVLTSMHALFVREHNRLAEEIAVDNPDFTDEQIFQEARGMVIAQLQSITLNEYLPALLGEDAISEYTGYDSTVDPSIANEFSTAAFRFGHSTLNDDFRFVGNDGVEVADDIALARAFFTPELLEETGIDSLLKYASSTLSQEIDLEVVDSLRNFLFGPPGAGGLDLVSLNIQRGRDHGLADYNSTREAYGLESIESFDEITSDADVAANLEALYGDVNNIDLWVGLMAEDHIDGGSLGETATTIIAEQFERLRDGDRLWYENIFSDREVRQIEDTTLGDIIERNTTLDSLQDNVFFFSPEISGTVVAESTSADAGLVAGEPIADSVNGERRDSDPFDSLTFTDPGGVSEVDLDLLANDQARNRDNDPSNGRDQRNDQDPNDRDPMTTITPMEGMTMELLDSEGNVVDTTETDADGHYRFANIDESGSYTVQMVSSGDFAVDGTDAIDVLISSGDVNARGIDFRMLV